MNDKKLTGIDSKPHKLALMLGEAKADMKYQIEMQWLIAELTKAKYDALINQGFKPEQALELCKKL